jgi:hypothetical protein
MKRKEEIEVVMSMDHMKKSLRFHTVRFMWIIQKATHSSTKCKMMKHDW